MWRRREIAVLFLILALGGFLFLTEENFTNPANLRALTAPVAPDILLAIGITLVLIAGGIDVSVGAVVGLSSLVAATLMADGVAPLPAIIAAVLSGSLVGAANGLLIAWIGVNPLVATLGMMVAVRGFLVAWTRGLLVADLPPEFRALAELEIGPFGIQIVVALVVLAIFYVLLNHTAFFRQLYFVGGNEPAARLLGVHVDLAKFSAYVMSGTLAGIAGILVLSRTLVASSQLGTGAELRAIPAAVIGGASLMGGEGNLIGPALAVFFIAMINDALILSGVAAHFQGFAMGLVLLIAVTIDALLHRRRRR